MYDRGRFQLVTKDRLSNTRAGTPDDTGGNTELYVLLKPHTEVHDTLKTRLEGHMGVALRWGGAPGRWCTHTHTLTHTAGGRCGGPAHAPLSGPAWAGSSRCIWRGFLAGRTRSPGLWDRQAAQAGAASTGAAARAAQPTPGGAATRYA